MGLVGGLLFFPITGPVRGFRAFLERLRDEAEAVLSDEGRAFAELIDLSMRHSAGDLSDADYAEQELELLEQLGSIREYRNELLDADAGVDEEENELPYDEADGDAEDALLDEEPDVYDEDGELLYAEPHDELGGDESSYGEPDAEEESW